MSLKFAQMKHIFDMLSDPTPLLTTLYLEHHLATCGLNKFPGALPGS